MKLPILVTRLSPAGSVPKNPLFLFVNMLLPLVVCLFLGIAWLLWREWRLADTPDVQYVLRRRPSRRSAPTAVWIPSSMKAAVAISPEAGDPSISSPSVTTWPRRLRCHRPRAPADSMEWIHRNGID